MTATSNTITPDALPSEKGPILPEAIRLHLGQLLATAFVQTEAQPPFADLLARLEAALSDYQEEPDAEFRRLLLAVVPALQRYAISIARDRHRADDLVQDTLLRAWRSRASFVIGTNFEAWTFTILRNHFYSDRRKMRETQDEDGAYAARLATLPEQADRLELADVQIALAKLSPPMRDALLLVAVSGASYEQAAAALGCQIGTVKSRVWRARDQLMRALGYGLPPEKWSSLRYGFEPCGGRFYGTEEAYGGRDRRKAASSRCLGLSDPVS